MEAPEKIYLSDFTDTTEPVFYVKQDKTRKTDIEYTRTDAVIEKAAVFVYHLTAHPNVHNIDGNDLVESFKEYMKEHKDKPL